MCAISFSVVTTDGIYDIRCARNLRGGEEGEATRWFQRALPNLAEGLVGDLMFLGAAWRGP